MISLVVAADTKGVIGKKDRIPWRIASDRVRLKNLTLGQVVVLGRKSFDSMVWYYDKSGRDMPGKWYVVVTRDRQYKPARSNAIVAHSVPDAMAAAQKLGNNIFVIGGSEIFKQALPLADRVYLTEVQADIDGDAFFPPLNKTEWHETFRESRPKDERNEYDTVVLTLERTR